MAGAAGGAAAAAGDAILWQELVVDWPPTAWSWRSGDGGRGRDTVGRSWWLRRRCGSAGGGGDCGGLGGWARRRGRWPSARSWRIRGGDGCSGVSAVPTGGALRGWAAGLLPRGSVVTLGAPLGA
eukprot:184842-Chlamydomonas_euryale.AAC.1